MSEKKILIVDDDEFILESFEMAFRKAGYIVLSDAGRVEIRCAQL